MGTIEQAFEKMNNPSASRGSPAARGPRRRRAQETRQPVRQRNNNENSRLGSTQQVSDEWDANKYFELPYDELNAAGMVVAGAGKRNQLSEEYRAIKRPILSAIEVGRFDGVKNSNIVMVTSCVSGEGKTFSAINLAISIAMERDRSVLLVDGDVTNPSCGERFGFGPRQKGLTDLLLDPELEVNDVVCQSDIENLRFLPAGSTSNHVTELLSSRGMADLVESLAHSFQDRVIIFDTPPILLTSEASVVADLAGQVVFVVAAESTTQGMVSDALRMINNHSRVGYVLNKTRKKQSNIYGYGYGYGYGT